jgi:uncharacterized damage-inducible protein DinB
MDLRQHFRLMSGWHRWATDRLYQVVDAVPEADYRRDTGLFFQSIHGTLNHILLIESLWRGRLVGPRFVVTDLAAELHADRAALRAHLFEAVGSWRPFIDGLSEPELTGDLTYTSMEGKTFTFPRVSLVHTLFTHGSHHRGQISTVLTQLGHPAPEMDFPYFLAGLPPAQLHGV